MTRTIKNCGEFGILSFLKTVNLTCDIFIDGGRSQECPESRTKDSITHGAAECINFLLQWVHLHTFPSPTEIVWKQARVDATSRWVCFTAKECGAEKPNSVPRTTAVLSSRYPRERHYFYRPCQEPNLPSAPERDSVCIFQGCLLCKWSGETSSKQKLILDLEKCLGMLSLNRTPLQHELQGSGKLSMGLDPNGRTWVKYTHHITAISW